MRCTLEKRFNLVVKYLFFAIVIILQSCSFMGRDLSIDTTHYLVRSGDTLATIASKFGVKSVDIVAVNKLTSPNRIWVGQDLLIPLDGRTYANKRIVVKKPEKTYLNEAPHITSMHWPIPGKAMGSGFGWRLFSFHEGIDIPAPHGTPIEAAHGGTIVYVGQKLRGYGKMVLIQASNVLTVYGHLSSYSVEIGDRVRSGEIIGFVGNSGDATGNHLHFETRVRDKEGKLIAVNPKKFFK